MMRNLFNILAKEHYIVYFNGQLVVTNKFLRDFKTPPEPEPQVQQTKEVAIVPPVVQQLTAPTIPGKNLSVPVPVKRAPLLDFIRECEVPERIRTRTSFYKANQYSKDAEKELILILSQGFQYDILVTSTKLYYKAGGMCKAIGNYLIEGTWRTEYENMQASIEKGTTQQHISKNLSRDDEDGHTRYKR